MIELNEQKKIALRGYRFIDLFCGIGGFHLALNSFGAECVFASDISIEARKIYKANFKIEPKGDIVPLADKAKTEIPTHDILCGGFPCQAFSVSGKVRGFEDPKTGKLFFEIIKIADAHKPRIILLENVANLEKHDGGKSIVRIKRAIEDVGYTVFYKVLEAKNFGVPQVRKRIYIVAFRKDLNIYEFEFPRGDMCEVRLNTIIEKNPSEKLYVNREFDFIDNMDEYEKKCKKPIIRIGKIGLGRQGERIYSINGCSTTLSSQSGGLGGKTGLYLIDRKIRMLSGRECARVMGFPDDFVIAQTDNLAHTQFGNSVVVNVLQMIVDKIIKKLP